MSKRQHHGCKKAPVPIQRQLADAPAGVGAAGCAEGGVPDSQVSPAKVSPAKASPDCAAGRGQPAWPEILDALLNYCAHRTNGAAEDIAQRTIAIALEQYPEQQSAEDLRRVCFGIARHLTWRARRNEHHEQLQAATFWRAARAPGKQGEPTQTQRIDKLFAALTSEQKAVASLLCEHLTVHEIAQARGVSDRAIRKMRVRIREVAAAIGVLRGSAPDM